MVSGGLARGKQSSKKPVGGPTGMVSGSCARCHSGRGFIEFSENFTDAEWEAGVVEPQVHSCAVCHDPHGNGNPAQLAVSMRAKLNRHLCGSTFGTTFVNISLENVKEASDEEVATMNADKPVGNMMAWRYIPNVGRPGAALSHATLFPQQPGDTLKAWHGEPKVTWNPVTWEQSPTQFSIINALAGLPILEYRWGMAQRGPHTLKAGIARELH